MDVEIGTDCKCDAALALRIFIGAQLDDRSGRAVAGSVEMAALAMGAAVDAVDHGIGRPLQFVIEAAFEQAPIDGHRGSRLARMHRRTALDAVR